MRDLRRIGRELAAIEAFTRAHARDDEALGGFIQRISPALTDPRHLTPVVDVLEQAQLAARGLAEPIFACVSVPAQFGKTTTISHWLAQTLRRYPDIFSAYVSYSATIAEDKSRTIRDYARLAGVELRADTDSVSLWRTPEGGGLAARGILGGAITGLSGLTILVVDDPHKNRAEAESRLMRERIWYEFSSSIWTRLRKRTSVIIVHTRWHEDDLIGRIKKDPRLSKIFRVINLPAILPSGESLWPEEMPLSLLELKRSNERDWWSIYMGEPRPREGHVFNGVRYYTERPSDLRVAIGTDFAYTNKRTSDWNVAIALGMSAEKRVYVLGVMRAQCDAPTWGDKLITFRSRWPGAPVRAYIGGTEQGPIDYLARKGLRVTALPARESKYVRAIPASDAWNDDKRGVHWPEGEALRDGSDMAAALACCLDFTGQGDAHDDDVDALSAGFDALGSASLETLTQPHVERPRPFPLDRDAPAGGRTRPFPTRVRPF